MTNEERISLTYQVLVAELKIEINKLTCNKCKEKINNLLKAKWNEIKQQTKEKD